MKSYDSFMTNCSETGGPNGPHVKLISSKKWQRFMVESLKMMTDNYAQKKHLLESLTKIVKTVPEQMFIQATLEIRPFKPDFQQIQPMLQATQSTMDSLNHDIKNSEKLKQGKERKHKMTEKTLTKQFDKEYHPFRYIVKQFKKLLQLKFKILVDSQKFSTFSKMAAQLKSDTVIFNQFIHKAAQPYKRVFQISSEEQNKKFQEFIDTYLQDNRSLNKSIRSILLYGCKFFYGQKLEQKIGECSNPEDFDIPSDFIIEGCYLRGISTLLQFSQSLCHEKALNKLQQLRSSMIADIDSFYQNIQREKKQLQMSAQIQICIVRFMLAKAKFQIIQLYSQLKYLQFIYGEQQICFMYQQASYMYSQLSTAFQVLEFED